jgi:hypothetical protein
VEGVKGCGIATRDVEGVKGFGVAHETWRL